MEQEIKRDLTTCGCDWSAGVETIFAGHDLNGKPIYLVYCEVHMMELADRFKHWVAMYRLCKDSKDSPTDTK